MRNTPSQVTTDALQSILVGSLATKVTFNSWSQVRQSSSLWKASCVVRCATLILGRYLSTIQTNKKETRLILNKRSKILVQDQRIRQSFSSENSLQALQRTWSSISNKNNDIMVSIAVKPKTYLYCYFQCKWIKKVR